MGDVNEREEEHVETWGRIEENVGDVRKIIRCRWRTLVIFGEMEEDIVMDK